ncbi:unnamed protein product, partial [Owenia fusiformis]
DFSYDPSSPSGPSNWKDDYPLCDGQNQSPIDITTQDTELDIALLESQLFSWGLDSRLRNSTLENIGNAVRINIPRRYHLDFSDGNLPGVFLVHDAKFNLPAEHIIDGDQAKLELQIVTWNGLLYDNYTDAVGKPDGIAIFSVLFSVLDVAESGMEKDNPNLQALNKTLYSIPNPGDVADLPSNANALKLRYIIPSLRRNRYYQYKGSFSSPPCDENVLRIVFADKIQMSKAQFEAFRRLLGSDGNPILDGLSRPVQRLNEREVKRSFLTPRMRIDDGPPVDDLKESCMNVFWVIDQSCSVFEQMDEVKQMLLDVTDKVIIGRNSVVMTLMKFDREPYYNFYARDTTSNAETIRLLNDIPIGQTEICETRTSRALSELKERFFLSRYMRSRYGVRKLPLSKDIVFIVSDGRTFPYGGRWPAIYKSWEIADTGADIYSIKLDNSTNYDYHSTDYYHITNYYNNTTM